MKTNIISYSLAVASVLCLFFLYGCSGGNSQTLSHMQVSGAGETANPDTTSYKEEAATANASTIMARKQVPILCYHQIRDWKPTDSKVSRDYIVPPAIFKAQMKLLADSGYHTILPDQLMSYLERGRPLPEKPVMLTFDDTDLSQYTVALDELNKENFKAVFFIMTVSINRPHYMSREQIKDLSDKGHVIGSHTWDHQNVKKLKGADWVKQIDKPTKQLEEITGKPIKYFAYPFGLWDTASVREIKNHGFTAAFQLAIKRDAQEPLYTIRRIIVPGSWSMNTFSHAMTRSF